MQWNLPGTTLSCDSAEIEHIHKQFSSMFLAGGIVLSQVCAVTGLEAYMVQNWVKRGFLPSPQAKRYNLNQLCRIININMLKKVLPMERIVGLLSYINGSLDDTSDDLIDDSKLYFMFVRLAVLSRTLHNRQEVEAAIEGVMESYDSCVPGAGERVKKVLNVMLTAWAAAQMHELAERMIAEL